MVNNLKPKQGLLFPGLRPGKPISNMTMLQLMKRMRFGPVATLLPTLLTLSKRAELPRTPADEYITKPLF